MNDALFQKGLQEKAVPKTSWKTFWGGALPWLFPVEVYLILAIALFIVRSSKISAQTKRMHDVPKQDTEAVASSFARMETRLMFHEAFAGLKLEQGISKGWTYLFFIRRLALVFIFRGFAVSMAVKLWLAVVLCVLQIVFIAVVKPFR